MPKQSLLPPLIAVQTYAKKFPQMWELIDQILDYSKNKYDVQWDRSVCLCPIAVAYSASTIFEGRFIDMPASSLVAALYTWRLEKIIYRFDEDLMEELFETADDIVVPVEVLEHLPAKCVYIEFPETLKQSNLDGFFAFIEHDIETQMKELRINPINKNGEESQFYALYLSPGATIGEGLQESAKYARQRAQTVKEMYPDLAKDVDPQGFINIQNNSAQFIEFCVQLLLYICAENADVEENPKQKSIYRPTSKVRDQFKEVRQWDVGVKIGASLRKVKRQTGEPQSTDMPPAIRKFKNRPHVRRAHWHHFWTGPRDNPKLILRWVSSIAVNAEDGDIIPTIIEEKGEPK